MGYARTQKGAKYRVALKHGLRAKGLNPVPKLSTKKLEKLYRRNVSKHLPKKAGL